MLAAEAVFAEGRQAVIDRASAVLGADTLDEPVVRFTRRRLLRRRPAPANVNLPDTRADAIRFAASFVAANHAVLDGVVAAHSTVLDPAAEALVVGRLAARLERTGQGLILISHRPAPLRLCARTLRLGGAQPQVDAAQGAPAASGEEEGRPAWPAFHKREPS